MKGAVTRATKTCNLFCEIAAKLVQRDVVRFMSLLKRGCIRVTPTVRVREMSLKELCHEIQPKWEITKCPLN